MSSVLAGIGMKARADREEAQCFDRVEASCAKFSGRHYESVDSGAGLVLMMMKDIPQCCVDPKTRRGTCSRQTRGQELEQKLGDWNLPEEGVDFACRHVRMYEATATTRDTKEAVHA